MIASRPSVLLVGDTLNFGGTEGQFVEVACGLDRGSWDVDVACIRAEGPLRARLDAVGVRPWSCGRGSFKSPRAVGAIRALARHLRERQIQVVHSFDFYSNVMGVLAARAAKVPAIIASQRDLGNLRPWHEQRIHSAMLRLATHVLVNSEATAERLSRSRAARTGRLSIVRNGVDLGRFRPRDSASAAAAAPTVGTLANLRPEKGLLQLVEAAALVRQQVPAVRFSIWGEGQLRPALEARIQALGLTDTVHLHGSTREPEKALQQCDIFVLPSLSEACSNVLLEAMATGLPVVTTRIGGNPNLIDDGRTGLLVPAGEPRPLGDAIARLLASRDLAGRVATGARARALAEFGMKRMIEHMEALYRRALDRETTVAGAAPAGSRG
jgi:glycosyltransferase involved in cell wall biosynthesis